MSTATELLRRALEALKDAKEEISDWGAYADHYFQEKWDYKGSITQYDPLIEDIRTYLDSEPEAEPVAFIQPNHLDKAQFMPFLCRVEPKQRDDFIPLYTRPEPKAEPVHQIAMAEGSTSTAWIDVAKDVFDDAGMYPEYKRRALYTRPEPEAEPLLWLCSQIEIQDGEDYEYFELEWDKDNVPYWVRKGWEIEPLYTRPEPARKPMTEEEIKMALLIRGFPYDAFRAGIRFAEKHHGIGVDDE